MYRVYIFDELYTFIEKRRRIVTAITYLSIGESVCFNFFSRGNKLFPREKQTVSTEETEA